MQCSNHLKGEKWMFVSQNRGKEIQSCLINLYFYDQQQQQNNNEMISGIVVYYYYAD